MPLNFKLPIPPITDRRGNAWKQPDPKTFCYDEHNDYVLMTEHQFNGLKEYTHSKSNVIYAGKMWRENKGGTWFLNWYDESEEVKFLEIILI